MSSIKKTDIPIIRSRRDDVTWLFAMDASVMTFKSLIKHLGNRIEVINGQEQLETICRLGEWMIEQIMLTFPPEKRETIERQAQYMYYHVDCGRPVTQVSGHYYMDSRHVDTMIYAAHEKCVICSHPAGCSRCELGKVFDAVLPTSRSKKESWATIDIDLD